MIFNSRTPPRRFRVRGKKHGITCGKCGRRDSVDFHPKGTGPVLCARCYRRVRNERIGRKDMKQGKRKRNKRRDSQTL